MIAEQDEVVYGHCTAKLTGINLGDTFTTGPTEAAHVIDNLVRLVSVIPSYENEAATKGGKVLPGSKTDTVVAIVHGP